MKAADLDAVILCGGLGTRLREETEFKPKPMVEIGGRPILWHIMKHYAYYGFKEFFIDRFGAMDWDCLVLDYVVLHPRWRGLKLGLLAARKMVDLLGGGCGLTVADVLPLDPDAQDLVGVPASWIPRHDTAESQREVRGKLRRYFKRLGFERVRGTDYYGLPMVRRTPTLADLLRPERGERG